ncbi:unnamed protein product [Boreogadus saida]
MTTPLFTPQSSPLQALLRPAPTPSQACGRRRRRPADDAVAGLRTTPSQACGRRRRRPADDAVAGLRTTPSQACGRPLS